MVVSLWILQNIFAIKVAKAGESGFLRKIMQFCKAKNFARAIVLSRQIDMAIIPKLRFGKIIVEIYNLYGFCELYRFWVLIKLVDKGLYVHWGSRENNDDLCQDAVFILAGC